MFAKFQRLVRRDVQLLLRRGQKRYGKHFIFVIIPQRNKDYNQWSVQIPAKLDKRATMRNMLKRSILDLTKSKDKELLKQAGKPVKVFVMVNKKALPSLIELIATSDKTTILN